MKNLISISSLITFLAGEKLNDKEPGTQEHGYQAFNILDKYNQILVERLSLGMFLPAEGNAVLAQPERYQDYLNGKFTQEDDPQQFDLCVLYGQAMDARYFEGFSLAADDDPANGDYFKMEVFGYVRYYDAVNKQILDNSGNRSTVLDLIEWLPQPLVFTDKIAKNLE